MNVDDVTFEQAVNAHYQSLYRFAFTLTRGAEDAADLTQSAFERLLRRPGQLREPGKLKSWLFTTLYRLFLEQRRHATRFPQVELEGHDLPAAEPAADRALDSAAVVGALQHIDEVFRAPLVLFYLEDHSYREIAEILDVPVGTVMSRLSRGKALLRELLREPAGKIVPLPLKAAS
jgi:RNA polymerase sigma-70 factor (ECF subfamily)